MAGFEGIRWAPHQLRYSLIDRNADLEEPDARVAAVSRSTHYGLFLAFEGIRFFVKRCDDGEREVVFLSLGRNLERFRKGIAFSLSRQQQDLVPSVDTLLEVLVQRFLLAPPLAGFLDAMAETGAQGYLRPFTFDEDQSIGVTAPSQPAIRAVVCHYDRYLGEPFSGVVVPHLVRAVGANGTGCLKLGINYPMSIKAVDAAQAVLPGAASALFLDDQLHLPLEERKVTEWDTSCALIGLGDGTVIKIPEGPLILPSVTIHGLVRIFRHLGIPVQERDMTYGELLDHVRTGNLVTVGSVGTAGVLNRCGRLMLADLKGTSQADHEADTTHPLYTSLGEARDYYRGIYEDKVEVPEGLEVSRFRPEKAQKAG